MDTCRKDGQKVKELFDDLKNIKDEFESIERPILVIEASPRKPDTPSSDKLLVSTTPTSTSPLATVSIPEFKRDDASKSSLIKEEKKLDHKEVSVKLDPPFATKSPESKQDEVSGSCVNKEEKKSNPNEKLAKLDPGLDSESREGSQEEITDWVFDELEKEVNTSAPATTADQQEK